MPDIKIFPYRDSSSDPYIAYEGSGTVSGSGINCYVLSDGALSFEGTEGQVFSLDHNLSSGTIWSVNDIGGFPLLEATASGNVSLAEFGGSVGIGTASPSGTIHVVGSNTGIPVQIVQMPSGHVANAFEAKDYLGVTGCSISSSGGAYFASNVGIGTTDPSSPLQIQPSSLIALRLSDTNITHGMTDVAPTDVFASFEQYRANDGGFIFRALNDGGTASDPAMFFVGINGSASPTAPAIVFRGGKRSGTTYGAVSDTEEVIGFDNYSTRLATILGNGNVGIGSGTPQYPLDVNGSGNFTKSITIGLFGDGDRPSSPPQGTIIFNTGDANINIYNGSDWILPDGTTT